MSAFASDSQIILAHEEIATKTVEGAEKLIIKDIAELLVDAMK